MRRYYFMPVSEFSAHQEYLVEQNIPKDATTADGLHCIVKLKEGIEEPESMAHLSALTNEEAIARRRDNDFPPIPE